MYIILFNSSEDTNIFTHKTKNKHFCHVLSLLNGKGKKFGNFLYHLKRLYSNRTFIYKKL